MRSTKQIILLSWMAWMVLPLDAGLHDVCAVHRGWIELHTIGTQKIVLLLYVFASDWSVIGSWWMFSGKFYRRKLKAFSLARQEHWVRVELIGFRFLDFRKKHRKISFHCSLTQERWKIFLILAHYQLLLAPGPRIIFFIGFLFFGLELSSPIFFKKKTAQRHGWFKNHTLLMKR